RLSLTCLLTRTCIVSLGTLVLQPRDILVECIVGVEPLWHALGSVRLVFQQTGLLRSRSLQTTSASGQPRSRTKCWTYSHGYSATSSEDRLGTCGIYE
ncbi:hypothetical protein DACRYDRAFT_97301, partial [Dacryopinax primogenitus]